jgi:hypothetical protein
MVDLHLVGETHSPLPTFLSKAPGQSVRGLSSLIPKLPTDKSPLNFRSRLKKVCRQGAVYSEKNLCTRAL